MLTYKGVLIMAIEAHETGLDWLTMTTTKEQRGYIYWAIFKSFTDDKIRPWRLRQYSGLEAANGEIAVGIDHKTNTAILIARGGIADDIFITRPPAPSQFSRLDIQTTVVYDFPQRDLLEEVYSTGGGVVKKKSWIVNNQGGQTVYLGSRQSQIFVRVYDAGIRHELAEKDTMFRYEIEVKKPLALPLAHVIWAQKSVASMRMIMADWMVDKLTARNIILPWERSILNEQIDSLTIRKTSEDSTFAWLGNQVAKAIEKLLDNGYTRDEILAVLFPSRVDAEW